MPVVVMSLGGFFFFGMEIFFSKLGFHYLLLISSFFFLHGTEFRMGARGVYLISLWHGMGLESLLEHIVLVERSEWCKPARSLVRRGDVVFIVVVLLRSEEGGCRGFG